jgi:hypothetical protein
LLASKLSSKRLLLMLLLLLLLLLLLQAQVLCHLALLNFSQFLLLVLEEGLPDLLADHLWVGAHAHESRLLARS